MNYTSEEYNNKEINNKCIDLYYKQKGICPVCGKEIQADLLIAKIEGKPCCIHEECLGEVILDEILTFPHHFIQLVQESLKEKHAFAEEIEDIDELIDLLNLNNQPFA